MENTVEALGNSTTQDPLGWKGTESFGLNMLLQSLKLVIRTLLIYRPCHKFLGDEILRVSIMRIIRAKALLFRIC